jgi:sialate O-acetylesterase
MRFLLLLCAAALAPAARADVKLHELFGDHMVLQQKVENAVWGTAAANEKVTVTLTKGDKSAAATATADDKGAFAAKLPPAAAGLGYTLTVAAGADKVTLKDVAVGEVWVCSGQSNMEWRFTQLRGGKAMAEDLAKGFKNNVRLFTVPKTAAAEPQAHVAQGQPYETKWLLPDGESVFTFSAVASYFGKHLQPQLNVPLGLIHTSWGGTPAESWTSKEKLAETDEIKYYLEKKDGMVKAAAGGKLNAHTPTSLYNGMIHPLLPYSVKGAIWYQGESNAGRAAEYRTLFPAMIEDWRARFKTDLPFMLVQLAPFHANDADGVAYAELRDAQLLATTKLKNVGMAVITDVGDLFDIHPQHKEPAGLRLALAARGIAYGQKVEYKGPTFKELTIDGDKAVVHFDGSSLSAKGSPAGVVNGFTVCGEDKYFYPAKAKVAGNTVVVTCEKVSKPVAVRFGWNNFPVCNLFNAANLPASPFRTDDFPLTTAAKK